MSVCCPESGLETLRAIELEQGLQARGLSDFVVLYQAVTESTNVDVLDFYAKNQKQAIAICEQQNAGKGRRGRLWHSPYARNIYCTIGIVKDIPATRLGLLSIVCGIALCQALSQSGFDDIRIKWPNDLYYQRKKLGGILIESRPCHKGGYFLAIGFGLNVLMTAEQLAQIPQAATSLGAIADGEISRQRILGAAVESIIKKIRGFDEESVHALIESFKRHDAFYNQTVCVLNGKEEISGIDEGISEHGLLRLRTESGERQFSAAEISLRGID